VIHGNLALWYLFLVEIADHMLATISRICIIQAGETLAQLWPAEQSFDADA
jgi:hypothetical protein